MKTAERLLTVFGLGYRKPASGTWGSLPPPAITLALVFLLGANGLSAFDTWLINGVLVILLLVFSYACLAWGDWAEAIYGKKDPGQVVADEVAGQAVALLALPWRAIMDVDGLIQGAIGFNIALAATAFFTFRIFDIVKPPPARGIQRWPSGWGILVDDLFAGVYALIVTQLLAHYLWPGVFSV